MNNHRKIMCLVALLSMSTAQAALIYDKQGSKLYVGGQVKTVLTHAGANARNSAHDASIGNFGRLKILGRTKLTDSIATFSNLEWQAGQGSSSKEEVRLKARIAYLGVDFRKYGSLMFGRYNDPFSYASDAISIMDDFSPYGGNNERNSGHLAYTWSRFGIDAGIAYQFATDNYNCDTLGSHYFKVDSGFSIYAGYTFGNIFSKPLRLRSAYLYLNGQKERDGGFSYTPFRANRTIKILIENLRSVDGSISWGNLAQGPYLGANYNYTKVKYAKLRKGRQVYPWDVESTTQAYEAVASYSFGNGIRIASSYHFINVKTDANNLSDSKGSTRWMQWLVDYNVSPRLKLWVEGVLDAGADDVFARVQDQDVLNGKSNAVLFGARYNF